MVRPMSRIAAALLILLVLVAACAGKGDPQPPAPDMASFESLVYPVLLRDCAFNNCHGSPDRFFQVLGPGRTRSNPTFDAMMPPDPAEVRFSYDRARSMLASSDGIMRSLLLTKPLEPRAGGVGHRGADHFGRNVYLTVQDPSYMILVQWATTATSAVAAPVVGAH